MEDKKSVLGKVAKAPLKLANWMAKPVYQPVLNQAKESSGRLLPLIKFLDPRRIVNLKQNARIETYEEAKQRLNVTESDIDKNYRNFSIISYIALTTFLCSFGGLLGTLVSGHYFNACSWFFIASISFAETIKYTFRAYQMKTHKLCSFSEFKNDAKNWMPTIRR